MNFSSTLAPDRPGIADSIAPLSSPPLPWAALASSPNALAITVADASSSGENSFVSATVVSDAAFLILVRLPLMVLPTSSDALAAAPDALAWFSRKSLYFASPSFNSG